MGFHQGSGTTAAKVLTVHVALVLLFNALSGGVEGQDVPQLLCLIECGVRLIVCAAICVQNPLCLLACGATEIGCIGSCNIKPVEIPPIVPTIGAAGRGEAEIQEGTVKAVAFISSSSFSGDNNIWGFLQFLGDSSTGVIHVKGRLAGLTPGIHGLHIHSLGDTTTPCTISTGTHFNPIEGRGAPSYQNCHSHDLGNIIAGPDGVAEISITDKHVALMGPHSILGRAIVIPANANDLGREISEPGKTNGNGAATFGRGIIMLTPLIKSTHRKF